MPETILTKTGLFHHVTTEQPEAALNLPLAPGEYGGIRVAFRAIPGPPLTNLPAGRKFEEQLIFWLAVTNHFNLYGFVRLREPGPTYELSNTHGVGVPFEGKRKQVRRGVRLDPGTPYDFEYTYGGGVARLSVQDASGSVVSQMEGPTTTPNVVMPRGGHERFRLVFGYDDEHGGNLNEFQSYGWQFLDLRVETFEPGEQPAPGPDDPPPPPEEPTPSPGHVPPPKEAEDPDLRWAQLLLEHERNTAPDREDRRTAHRALVKLNKLGAWNYEETS